jgi:hypothetical protein
MPGGLSLPLSRFLFCDPLGAIGSAEDPCGNRIPAKINVGYNPGRIPVNHAAAGKRGRTISFDSSNQGFPRLG